MRNLGQPFNRMPEDRDKEFRELEERLAQQKNQEQQRTPENGPTVMIEDWIGFWRIPNIPYRGKIYTADLAKYLLDNGEYRTQEGWAEFRKIAEPRGEFYTGDMPTQYAIFSTIANCQGQEAQEAREFIKKQMRERWLVTLTRVVYNPDGWDDIFHNYGLKSGYGTQTNLVGPTQEIKESGDTSYLKAILGTKDVKKINEFSQLINGTDTCILRMGSRPEKPEERIAKFLSYSDGVYLDCYNFPSNTASLGIRLIENKTNGGPNK